MRKESTQRHTRKGINKKNTAVYENSFANPFSDFPIERWKGNPWNPDLDFLIEIHPENGFLGGKIRFRISRSITKSEIPISQSNATPVFILMTLGLPRQTTSIYKKSRLDIQKRAFSGVGAKIWNDIPAPKKSFKTKLQSFLVDISETWWLYWYFPNYLCSENRTLSHSNLLSNTMYRNGNTVLK